MPIYRPISCNDHYLLMRIIISISAMILTHMNPYAYTHTHTYTYIHLHTHINARPDTRTCTSTHLQHAHPHTHKTQTPQMHTNAHICIQTHKVTRTNARGSKCVRRTFVFILLCGVLLTKESKATGHRLSRCYATGWVVFSRG